MYPIEPISPRTVQELSLRPCRTYFLMPLRAGHRARGFPAWVLGHLPNCQNTRGLLHISSLPVKGTSCHSTRIKTSPTFFFQCLVMSVPPELRKPPRKFPLKFSSYFFFFFFLTRTAPDPSALAITPHVLVRSINPTISRPVAVNHSLSRPKTVS